MFGTLTAFQASSFFSEWEYKEEKYSEMKY